ncbi:hypothetical protein [Saccharothrix australiensis]|uniref:Uncharacterized protein n=1 Tax=Saccharothrix australiensis TaxID=2072 RepID=A0A495VXP3_9PSEU|nr:hypothetical protein [Saccharothrix australiensis]RKT54182.1 hypothetical protein C8E97_2796 [Saccharothrix australiensis]
MTIKRRVFLAGALAAPLFGQLQAQASALGRSVVTLEEGWVRIDWTDAALARLEQFGGTPFAVAPARMVGDPARHSVRLPLRSALVDGAFTDGQGEVDGGFGVRTDEHRVVLEAITRESGDPRAHGERTVDGRAYPKAPVSTGDVGEGRVVVQPGLPAAPSLPGRPTVVRVSDIPVRPTRETLEVFEDVLGDPVFTLGTVIAHVSGEGSYRPEPVG